MWCEKCHYGSDATKAGPCPQCGRTIKLNKRPFPDKPLGKGSGKPNNKTAKDHNHPNKNIPK